MIGFLGSFGLGFFFFAFFDFAGKFIQRGLQFIHHPPCLAHHPTKVAQQGRDFLRAKHYQCDRAHQKKFRTTYVKHTTPFGSLPLLDR